MPLSWLPNLVSKKNDEKKQITYSLILEVLDCNAGPGGAAAMSMTIAKADVQQAPGAGWSLDGGVYKKTVQASTTNTAMGTTANVKELVMTHTVNSGG